jgi:hypothetical protein
MQFACATDGWNVMEVFVTVTVGVLAGSIAPIASVWTC